jgi:GxxExxY protein
MENIIYKEESYEIIGLCMDIHRHLGPGFLEIVYKDALEIELKNSKIDFFREKEHVVYYKGNALSHKFYTDFVIMDKIILEIKSVSTLLNEHEAQCINYLKVSGIKLAILINFGEKSLAYKRLLL